MKFVLQDTQGQAYHLVSITFPNLIEAITEQGGAFCKDEHEQSVFVPLAQIQRIIAK